MQSNDVNKVHTVNYSVTFAEYTGIATEHQASFTFEIKCPASLISSSLVEATNGHNFYDAASPGSMKILAPQVKLGPEVCFTIKAFELFPKGKAGQPTPAYAQVMPDSSGFEIQTNNRTFVGYHELSVRVVASSGEKVLEHDFSLTIYDSCNLTQIEASAAITDIRIPALEDKIRK